MREISAVGTGIYGQRRGENLGRKKKQQRILGQVGRGFFSTAKKEKYFFQKLKKKKKRKRNTESRLWPAKERTSIKTNWEVVDKSKERKRRTEEAGSRGGGEMKRMKRPRACSNNSLSFSLSFPFLFVSVFGACPSFPFFFFLVKARIYILISKGQMYTNGTKTYTLEVTKEWKGAAQKPQRARTERAQKKRKQTQPSHQIQQPDLHGRSPENPC